jgi:hypothetical protein
MKGSAIDNPRSRQLSAISLQREPQRHLLTIVVDLSPQAGESLNRSEHRIEST